MRVASLGRLASVSAVVLLLAAVMASDAAATNDPPDVSWTDQFGTIEFDNAGGVAVGDGGVYVTGYVEGALPGQTHAGSYDVFLRKYGTEGTVLWTRQFGSDIEDFGLGVAADDGGVYVTGYTEGALPGQTPVGDLDVFLRKYDQAGHVVWTRQFGTTGYDIGRGVAVDDTGVYVTGLSQGTWPGQVHAGDKDMFLVKFDQAGNVVWTRQFGTAEGDEGQGVAVSDTGIYVVGETGGAFPGQINAGKTDVLVRKYDSDGNEVWTRQFGTDGYDSGFGMAVNATGVYAIGFGAGELPGQTHAGANDVLVRKYDSDGNEVWTRQFGTSGNDFGRAAAVDATGVYVSGDTNAAFPGHTSAGSSDPFVRKYDTLGNEVWTQQFGTSGYDKGSGVAVDIVGLYVAGDASGAFPGETIAGVVDVFVRKYDSGNMVCLGSLVTIAGTESGEVLHGTPGDDVIDGKGGADVIYGAGGDDKICGGDGPDKLFPGPGDDIVHGNAGNDEINFSSSGVGVTVDLNAQTASGQGTDSIYSVENAIGTQYDDIIKGTSGPNWLRGIEGDDEIDARGGDDTIGGGSGDDMLVGGNGNDTVFAYPGSDIVKGGFGNDSLGGGANNDVIFPGGGDDSVLGGYGTDTVSYIDSPNPVTVNLGVGNAFGFGSDTIGGVTKAEGSPQGDTLNGSAANNVIHGLGGNDKIDGKDGNDTLYGQDGNDTVKGGPGDDSLFGGNGTDSCTTGETHTSCEAINTVINTVGYLTKRIRIVV